MSGAKVDWMKVLRARVEDRGITAVAADLNLAKGTVSTVLSGKYGASTKNIEERVLGVYMNETVECPLFGEITRDRCIDHQNRPRINQNPWHNAVHIACRQGCRHSKHPKSFDERGRPL